MDPITAVANAVTSLCELGKEYLKFLQTPQGQEVAKVQLADLQNLKGILGSIGDSIKLAVEGAVEQGKKNK